MDTDHEAEESSENGGHRPCWVPCVWVEVTNGKAQPETVRVEVSYGNNLKQSGRKSVIQKHNNLFTFKPNFRAGALCPEVPTFNSHAQLDLLFNIFLCSFID